MIKEKDKTKKIVKIVKEGVLIFLMIVLIVFIENDYLLSGVYVVIVIVSFLIKYEKKDLLFLIFGLVIMTIFEYIFIQTGVETFNRNSLFGIMPLWLPILWAYAFVAIKRAINILR